MNTPSRTLHLSLLRDKGIAAATRQPEHFGTLFKLLWGLDVLTRTAADRVENHLGRGEPFAACQVLVHPRSFRHRDVWSLFWSVTFASMEIAEQGRQMTHEPEMNGAYMALIRTALSSFEPATSHRNVAMIIGDHATLGNEGRTGADFGLIIEVERKGEKRFLVTLLQAKRATNRLADVRRAAGDSTQLDLLVTSGIGAFLFYIGHEDPAGLGPTTRDADATRSLDPARIDSVKGADDFAARLAVAAHLLFRYPVPYALPGFGATGGREDALKLLFNPDIPGIKVNDVLIARIGDVALSPKSVVDLERDWQRLVDQHRDAVINAQGPIQQDRNDEYEPPIRRD